MTVDTTDQIRDYARYVASLSVPVGSEEVLLASSQPPSPGPRDSFRRGVLVAIGAALIVFVLVGGVALLGQLTTGSEPASETPDTAVPTTVVTTQVPTTEASSPQTSTAEVLTSTTLAPPDLVMELPAPFLSGPGAGFFGEPAFRTFQTSQAHVRRVGRDVAR
jgi:hypothetical protein